MEKIINNIQYIFVFILKFFSGPFVFRPKTSFKEALSAVKDEKLRLANRTHLEKSIERRESFTRFFVVIYLGIFYSYFYNDMREYPVLTLGWITPIIFPIVVFYFQKWTTAGQAKENFIFDLKSTGEGVIAFFLLILLGMFIVFVLCLIFFCAQVISVSIFDYDLFSF